MQRGIVSRVLYIYRWIYSAVLAACAVCLGGECVSLYRAEAFSRSAVADRLSEASVLLYTVVFMTAINIALNLLFPAEDKKLKATQTPYLRLMRLRRTRQLDGAALPTADGLKRKRLVNRCILAGGILLTSACFVWLYTAFFKRLAESGNNAFILYSMRIFVPFTALILGGILISELFYDKHLKDEIALYVGTKPSVSYEKRSLFPLTAALIAIAIGLLVWGYCGGGFKDVLTKANNICTECIGLG